MVSGLLNYVFWYSFAFVVVTKQVFGMHNMMTNLLHESGQSGRLVSSGYVEVVRSETMVGEVDL